MTGPRAGATTRDKRRIRRTKVFLVAELADDGAAPCRRAHVLDISPAGARLHARAASRAGALVDLVVAGARQAGSVVWVKHPTFGVRFTESLSAERLDRIVAGQDGGETPGRPAR